MNYILAYLSLAIFTHIGYVGTNITHKKKYSVIFTSIGIIIFIIFYNCQLEANDDLKNTSKFLAGVVTAYAIHETGHGVTAFATGTNMDWKFNDGRDSSIISFREYSKNDLTGLFVDSAGIITELAVTEYILRSKTINKTDPFIKGMVFWNTANPIIYALDYWFIHKINRTDGGVFLGDIKGIEYHSNSEFANIFAAASAAIAINQIYRYIKSENGIRANLLPTKKGVGLSISIPF